MTYATAPSPPETRPPHARSPPGAAGGDGSVLEGGDGVQTLPRRPNSLTANSLTRSREKKVDLPLSTGNCHKWVDVNSLETAISLIKNQVQWRLSVKKPRD